MNLTVVLGGFLLLRVVRRVLHAPDAPPGRERTDEELFDAYIAGEEAAFGVLWQRYAPPLTRMMRRQARSQQDAGDLVQQTFLQLHRARNDFRTGSQLRPWLYTIALNLRREHFRKLGRRRESAMDLDDKPSLQPTTAPLDASASETAEQVRAALSRLPEGQRLVIQLHWFEGLPMAEVADVLGASVSAVKVRAHRGYKVLRELLEKTDAPETIGLAGNRIAGDGV